MYRVIVTVKRIDEKRGRDLEVPAEIKVTRLAEMIAQALRWEMGWNGKPMRYQIEAQPLGRFLQPAESLASAGVWDGAWLVLHPEGSTQLAGIPREDYQDQKARPPLSMAGPVTGWRSLGLDQPSNSDRPSAAEQRSADSL